jgi:hypothetical protein
MKSYKFRGIRIVSYVYTLSGDRYGWVCWIACCRMVGRDLRSSAVDDTFLLSLSYSGLMVKITVLLGDVWFPPSVYTLATL